MTASEPRVGCGAAIVVGGRVLLVKRLREPEAGCWGLPGGKIDLFEPLRDATEREIFEELGIGIEAITLLCVVDHIDRAGGEHWLAPVFLVTTFTGEPVNAEPDKHGEIGWFEIDAPPRPLTRAAETALQALAGLGGAASGA